MRILAGDKKGLLLSAPKFKGTRPILARVRKSCFDIIGNNVKNSNVLDLFAGAGTFGIEALSRGAKSALFVDYSDQALKLIKTNLSKCKFLERGRLIKIKLPNSLNSIQGDFSLIFIGAPYDLKLTEPVLEKLANSQLLLPDSTVIAQISRREELLTRYGKINLKTKRSYGDTKLYFYQNLTEGEKN